MKVEFFISGRIIDNILDVSTKFNPIDNAPEFVLKPLDYLIGFIRQKKPEDVESFVDGLMQIYDVKVKSDYFAEKGIELQPLLIEYKNIVYHPDLSRLALNYYIQVLKVSKEKDWYSDVDIVWRGFHYAILHPHYYNLQTLIEVMGREEAVKLWKMFVTNYRIDNRSPPEPPFVELKTLYEERRKEKEDGSWKVIHTMLADGKYAYLNVNCTWMRALEDLPDDEIKYYICCYGDYEDARNFHNNIILTMEHTLAQGDRYCSRVMHDTRVDYDLQHPPIEFWDELYLLKDAESNE
ncbi:MAG: hypothetical protein BAJATHORv1_10551 [Candidatus Thorarchaeota archaeon]|nr:MAG: hypothetical protein BAJATHORv1_10551 [Candidatus Thorarchaeota archaeon]